MVVSLKSKKTQVVLVSAICVLLVVAIVIIVMVVNSTPPETTKTEKGVETSLVVEDEKDIQAFVEQFGYDVTELYSVQQAYIPIEFNELYLKYNEVQKANGLDLEEYKGEQYKLYIYTISNFKALDKAFFSVMVIDDRVIGGYISQMNSNGIIYDFDGEAYELPTATR